MKTSLHLLVSLLLPLFFLLISFSSLCHALYDTQNSTFFSEFQLWDLNNSDCCSWDGVTCDDLGHVIEFDLRLLNLTHVNLPYSYLHGQEKPPSLKEDPEEEDEENSFLYGSFDWKILLIGFGCGVLLGLCFGYILLNEKDEQMD